MTKAGCGKRRNCFLIRLFVIQSELRLRPGSSCHIQVHENEMAYASGHDKEMEHLMGAEAPVPGIEKWELQGINHASCSVNNAPGQKPEKGGHAEGIQQFSKHKHTDPSHCDVDQGGKPFGTGDPTGLDDHAAQSNAPDQGKQGVAKPASQHDETDRGVGAGNQYKDHHVIQLAEDPEIFSRQVYGVISGAGPIQQDHAGDEDCHGGKVVSSG